MIPPPAPLRRSTTTATTLYTKNKRGRFVYSWRLSLVSEMTWRARLGYVNTGVGLQKSGNSEKHLSSMWSRWHQTGVLLQIKRKEE